MTRNAAVGAARNPVDARDTVVSADVLVDNCGSIWLFRPQSDVARQWIDENVSDESTWFGQGLAVEHRYGPDLVLGMRSDGLTVERGNG